jgi:phosphomannomutase
MNAVTVTQASQGLCAYLRTVHPCLAELRQMGVIVGHDGRYNSRLFARLTAAVFLSRKIKVQLLRFLSFLISFLQIWPHLDNQIFWLPAPLLFN